EVMKRLSALGKYGLMLVIAAFVAWILVKWWRRYLFIRQLRMDRVSVDELREMMQNNRLQALVDVRSAITQAATGRIPGALAIDMQRIAEGFDGVPADGEVVLYCACPNEATAVKVAEQLRELGDPGARPVQGGLGAGTGAGHEAEG